MSFTPGILDNMALVPIGQSGGSVTIGTLKDVLQNLSDVLKKRLVNIVGQTIDCAIQKVENVLSMIEEGISAVLTVTLDFLRDYLGLEAIKY